MVFFDLFLVILVFYFAIKDYKLSMEEDNNEL